MQNGITIKEVGGWRVPCSPCDYRKLEKEAEKKCEVLREKLAALKKEPLRKGEKELSRRRTVKILTDMYYEQRGNMLLFRKRAEEREERAAANRTEVVISLPVIPAADKCRLF